MKTLLLKINNDNDLKLLKELADSLGVTYFEANRVIQYEGIREITEEQAYKLAEGAKDFPVLVKEEDEITESAVTLKKFPTGYLLGVSCDTKDLFKLFFSPNLNEMTLLTESYIMNLREKGNPFA
ncbi:hypothetical protein [Bernardetia sp. MNP-M8]|uniref:hypothetical protein n=1 Tax=Bernardetia sp. MNP-M8 TaxID=3127470 RepID=UPI0030CF0C7E